MYLLARMPRLAFASWGPLPKCYSTVSDRLSLLAALVSKKALCFIFPSLARHRRPKAREDKIGSLLGPMVQSFRGDERQSDREDPTNPLINARVLIPWMPGVDHQ